MSYLPPGKEHVMLIVYHFHACHQRQALASTVHCSANILALFIRSNRSSSLRMRVRTQSRHALGDLATYAAPCSTSFRLSGVGDTTGATPKDAYSNAFSQDFPWLKGVSAKGTRPMSNLETASGYSSKLTPGSNT